MSRRKSTSRKTPLPTTNTDLLSEMPPTFGNPSSVPETIDALLEANTELIHHCADLQSENDVQAQQSALLYVNINIISTNAQNACNHTGSVYERLEKNLMYMTKQYEKFVEKGKQQPSASNSINPNENGVNIRDKSRT